MITTLWRRVSVSGVTTAGATLACLINMAAGTPALAGVKAEPLVEQYAANLDDREAVPQPLVKNPMPLSIGVDGMIEKRTLSFDGFGSTDATMQRLAASLGADVFPWFTVRGLLGSSDFKSDVGNTGRIGGDLEWGLGAEMRLVNWRIEPMMCNISWIHFDASARYVNGRAEDSGNKAEWHETYGDVTVSMVAIPPKNEESVRSIALFAGPAVSWIDGSLDTTQGVHSDFSEDQRVGFSGGLIVIPHENIKLKLETEIFKDISYEAALEFHF